MLGKHTQLYLHLTVQIAGKLMNVEVHDDTPMR